LPDRQIALQEQRQPAGQACIRAVEGSGPELTWTTAVALVHVSSKVQAALLQLRASISSAEVLLKEQAPAAEIDTVLASAREEISAIHIDVKDLAQTITIVEEVSAGLCG
jgi:hypothetical protein